MMPNSDADALKDSILKYERQLSEVEQAISVTTAVNDLENLVSLRSDIEELIFLTKQNLKQLECKKDSPCLKKCNEEDPFEKEYARFKEEIETSEAEYKTTDEGDLEAEKSNIDEELNAIIGMKCQAPFSQKWGEIGYHNALVYCVHEAEDVSHLEDIKVKVMFTNPTCQEMLPCPYYLGGECKFEEKSCRFSHGEIVNFSHLKEYREPDFSKINRGSRVLVKQKDNLWHGSIVLTINSKQECEVKLESGGITVEVDLQNVLPLDSVNSISESEESESDSDVNLDEPYIDQNLINKSLLNNPSSMLGDWEKHTRGIGSQLMAKMGYVIGTGLGPVGDGRINPVEAMIFPTGKSLDHCMKLKQKAGGNESLFAVEKRLKRQRRKAELQQKRKDERERKRRKGNTFDFLNSVFQNKSTTFSSGESSNLPSCSQTKDKFLKTETSRSLNVESFKLRENIGKAQRELFVLESSLSRHTKGSPAYKKLVDKIFDKKNEIQEYQQNEKCIDREQLQRKTKRQMTVF